MEPPHQTLTVIQLQVMGSTIGENVKCEKVIKVNIAMTNKVFTRTKHFCGPVSLELRKIFIKRFVYSIVLYKAEI